MTIHNPLIMEISAQHKGLGEWPGSKHNPEIVALFETVGHAWVKDDETPWCAAFVGSVLAEAGLPHTGKLNARSYMEYGVEVSQRDVMPGDIVVFWRGSPDGWQGHVAFFVKYEGDRVIVRGGNQSNRVTDSPYPISRVLVYRRAIPADTVGNRPTLREGSAGVFVKALQERLKELRYFPGKIDGDFSDRTDGAVRTFQKAYDLKPDGIVGRNTWNALDRAVPRPERNVTKQDLRDQGSRTIGLTDLLKKIGVTGGGLSIGSVPLAEGLSSVPTELATAASAIETGKAFALQYWWVLLILAGVGAVWWIATKLEDTRLDDARTGANVK